MLHCANQNQTLKNKKQNSNLPIDRQERIRGNRKGRSIEYNLKIYV